jgi:hypothetical protein
MPLYASHVSDHIQLAKPGIISTLYTHSMPASPSQASQTASAVVMSREAIGNVSGQIYQAISLFTYKKVPWATPYRVRRLQADWIPKAGA